MTYTVTSMGPSTTTVPLITMSSVVVTVYWYSPATTVGNTTVPVESVYSTNSPNSTRAFASGLSSRSTVNVTDTRVSSHSMPATSAPTPTGSVTGHVPKIGTSMVTSESMVRAHPWISGSVGSTTENSWLPIGIPMTPKSAMPSGPDTASRPRNLT